MLGLLVPFNKKIITWMTKLCAEITCQVSCCYFLWKERIFVSFMVIFWRGMQQCLELKNHIIIIKKHSKSPTHTHKRWTAQCIPLEQPTSDPILDRFYWWHLRRHTTNPQRSPPVIKNGLSPKIPYCSIF